METPKARTVAEYLEALPPERRKVVAAVRRMVRKHIPPGYEEGINWGAIGYTVPLARYPNTYNGQPLCYVALAAQKNHYSLYVMCAYGDPKKAAELKAAFKAAGKKLDMGKACVRFKSLDDLPLDAVGKLIASVPADAYIARCEALRRK